MARMNADVKAAEYKGIAEEAALQLACSKEFGGWMVSLMKAIQLDREHLMGSGVQGLADLGIYLAETHLSDVENACDAVDSGLNQVGSDK